MDHQCPKRKLDDSLAALPARQRNQDRPCTMGRMTDDFGQGASLHLHVVRWRHAAAERQLRAPSLHLVFCQVANTWRLPAPRPVIITRKAATSTSSAVR